MRVDVFLHVVSNSLQKINIAPGTSPYLQKQRIVSQSPFSRGMLAFRREMFASLFGDERIAKYSEVRKALVHDVLLMPHKIFSHCASFVKYPIVKKIPPNPRVSKKKHRNVSSKGSS